jgi:hypothetical protein
MQGMFQSKNNDCSSSPCQFSSRTFIESMLKGFGSSSVTHRPIDIHILTHLHSPSMDSYVLVVHGPNKSSTFLCTSLAPIIPPSNIVAKRQEVKPFLKDSCCRDSLLLGNRLPFLIELDSKEEFHQTKSSFGSNCMVFTLPWKRWKDVLLELL